MKDHKLLLLLALIVAFSASRVQAQTIVTDPSTGLKWISDNDTEYNAANSSSYYIYSKDDEMTVTIGEASTSITGEYFFPNEELRAAIYNKASTTGKITKYELESYSTWRTLSITGSSGLFNPEDGGAQGLEYLTRLTSLYLNNCCQTSGITLDLTKNVNLQTITMSNTPMITSVDLSGTALQSITYDKANLKRLILKNCVNLATNNGGTFNVSGTDSNRGALEELDIEGCTGVTFLNCDYNNLQRVSVKNCSNLTKFFCKNNYLCNRTDTEGVFDPDVFVISGCYNLEELQASTNLIHFLGLEGLVDPNTGKSKLAQLEVKENFLEGIAIDTHPEKFPYLTRLIMHRCGLTDKHYNVDEHNQLTQLQINGGRYERQCKKHGVPLYAMDPSMRVNAINVAHMADLTMLLCQKELLETLDFSNNSKINYVQLGQNLLLSLDLSPLTYLGRERGVTGGYPDNQACHKSCTWRRQEAIQDLHVLNVDGVDKVGIYLPNGYHDNTIRGNRVTDLLVNGVSATPEKVTQDGKDYLIISSGATADLPLNNKLITYKYDTGIVNDVKNKNDIFNGKYFSDPLLTYNIEVKVHAYPYIMYMNPATKSGTGVDYYSGTIYLDYEAIVPPGVQAYIATGVRDKNALINQGTTQAEDQLVLVEVADGDDNTRNVIPALTPVYVKSTTKTGLIPFDKTWVPADGGWLGKREDQLEGYDYLEYDEGDAEVLQYRKDRKEGISAAVTIPPGNILSGTLEDITVGKRTTLTLGREKKKGTGMIGFWPYEGTTIKANRCYINENDISWSPSSAKAGVSFFFSEDMMLTGIQEVSTTEPEQNKSAWYTVAGTKHSSAPNHQGIYIHNGKKAVIK